MERIKKQHFHYGFKTDRMSGDDPDSLELALHKLKQVDLTQATASAPVRKNSPTSFLRIKSANCSLVNAFPLYFVNTLFDAIFSSETNAAPRVLGLKVLVPSDKFSCLI